MKNISLLISLLLSFSCKSQNYPLNTDTMTVPNNSHLKDTNNDLDQYIGIHTANYNGNEIKLFVTKVNDRLIKYGSKQFYRDVLDVRYTIRNSAGIILENTNHSNFQISNILFTIESLHVRPNNMISLSYGGVNCGVGWGLIYLKKLNANQFSWNYRPNSTITNSTTCPPGTDTTVYLPVTDSLVFTKQ